METTTLSSDIKVFYVPAKSFPDGIQTAQDALHSLVPFSTQRKYFGISRPENGIITYKACAEELIDGEAEKFGCNTVIIRKGIYVSETIRNYADDLQSIAHSFQQLLAQPGLDPQGYCVEFYTNEKDVTCMIRLE